MADKKFLKFLVASLVVGWALTQAGRTVLKISRAVDPLSVADIASRFPPGGEAFIVNAWEWVADHVQYEPVISSIEVNGEEIICEANCATPTAVLDRGLGNCYGSSLLLTSILRYRLPPEEVFTVLGYITKDGEKSGHAWVEVKRFDDWYILESTKENIHDIKFGMNAKEHKEYTPEYYFNDVISSPFDKKKFRINVQPCGCNKWQAVRPSY